MFSPKPSITDQVILKAKAARELRSRASKEAEDVAPDEWDEWLHAIYPKYVTSPFADRHVQLWDWVEQIEKGQITRPFVAIWPRGGAKSTTAELAVVRLGARQARRYVWYVSATQEQADKHVENIASLLENPRLGLYYPNLTQRALTKYGHSKGWRRERLRTRSGLTVDALGLDVAARGAKVEESRPDMIILDDIDDNHDTVQATLKKISTLTQEILPSGSNDLAVLFIQNLINSESVASRIVDGRADFITNRILSGPFPAVTGLEVTQTKDGFKIKGGRATWEGQSLEVCQNQIVLWGYTAFLKEAQHDVSNVGGKWSHIAYQHIERGKLPRMTRIVIWIDPAVTSTDNSDCQGCQADGLGEDKKIYRLYSWEGIDTPENIVDRAIHKAIDFRKEFGIRVDNIGIETDQGGDTWKTVYKSACDKIKRQYKKDGKVLSDLPRFASDKAGAGYGSKAERNSQMLTAYENGQVIHVLGTHVILETALNRFPNKPLDLCDAAFWSWDDLVHKTYSISNEDIEQFARISGVKVAGQETVQAAEDDEDISDDMREFMEMSGIKAKKK